VRGQIEEVFSQGATEFVVVPFANRERTLSTVAEMLK
jgi:hypothetical protein